MTRIEKTGALVRKALDSAWDYDRCPLSDDESKLVEVILRNDQKSYGFSDQIGISNIIFSRDFARALFGEELIQYPEGDTYTVTAKLNPTPDFARSDELFVFQYHLQQAVISDDPIGYMYKAVFGDE